MEVVVDPTLEKALKIFDNHKQLISGESTLQEIGCHEVNLTYRLYMFLCETFENSAINVQATLPSLLNVIEPDIVLPAKLSNFTRKVRKAVEKNSDVQDDIISGIYKKFQMSSSLTEVGLSPEALAKGEVSWKFPPGACIKIKDALEMRTFAVASGIKFKQVVSALKTAVPMDLDSMPNHDVNVVRTQLSCLHRQQQDLLHLRRKEDWEKLMTTLYSFPSKKPPASAPELEEGPEKNRIESLVARLIACYQQVTTMSTEMSQMAQGAHLQRNALKTINAAYYELKTKHNTKLNEILTLKERIASLTPRNVSKKIKRRNLQIESLQTEVAGQNLKLCEKEEELQNAQEHIIHLTNSLDTIKKEKLKLQKNRSYLKKKADNAKEESGAKLASSKETISTLENENLNLEEKLSEFLNEKKISTFKDGKYTNEVREVYMNLISMGVPIGKVKSIVEGVLEGILRVGVDRLPGKTSASMMAIEAQVIGQAQAAEAMLANANNTLQLDGTRKHFREYGSFQISTSAGISYSLGIAEMLTGNAKSFLNETLSILSEMSEVVADEDQELVKIKLLQSISNTMTDRSVVNKKYCSDLQAVRKDVFGLLYDNWDTLPEEEKTKLTKINDLYCGLHVIANMASSAQTALKDPENPNNASTVIWQTSKAFTPGGDQKSGAAEEFAAFLEGKQEKNTIASFAHQRFNILFHNGSALSYHFPHILDFLDTACPNSNRLLREIQSNLADKVILAQCRALGMVDKLITGPLFRLVEQKDCPIFSLNSQWLLLVEFLECNSTDPTPIMTAQPVFTNDAATITKDHLYHNLFLNSNNIDDEETRKALMLICNNMAILVKRQLKDQLPGGKYFMPSAEVVEATNSAPLHNKISEADFSDLDRLVTRAPQKSTISKSSAICFTRNKSAKWLQSLPEALKAKYMGKARELAPKRKKQNFLNMKAIREERRKLQQARLEKRATDLEKKRKLLEDLKSRVETQIGVLECEDSVRQHVSHLSSAGGKKILKDQISYHKLVLKSVISDKSLIQWSHEGKPYTLDQLSQNLLKIISDNWSLGVPETITNLNSSLRVNASGATAGTSGSNATVASVGSNITTTRTKQNLPLKRGNSKSKSTKAKKRHVEPPPAVTCSPGDYVAVAFEEGKWFPGMVFNKESSLVDIGYLHPSGKSGENRYMWPRQEDRLLTDEKYIFANIIISKRDSFGRFWIVEDKPKIDMAYQAYASAYFQ